ncbi:MAG: outer membrane beta-barrel protein [Woeseiaceae bacterium]|nr:outer membrane beta-barrel protein [Woeseiaceae bacterium]
MATGLLLALVSTSSLAEGEFDVNGDAWYAGIRVGLSTSIDSRGEYLGKTQAVYGGSPVIDLDNGTQFALVLGREVFAGMRLELEASYLTAESDASPVLGSDLRSEDVFRVHADLESIMVLAKIGYDFEHLNWWVDPYVRVGVGVAETTTNARQSVDFNSPIWAGTSLAGQSLEDQGFAEGKASDLAWDLAVGFRRQLNKRWGIRFEYSYLDQGESRSGISGDGDAIVFSDPESQQIAFGVDWRFQ